MLHALAQGGARDRHNLFVAGVQRAVGIALFETLVRRGIVALNHNHRRQTRHGGRQVVGGSHGRRPRRSCGGFQRLRGTGLSQRSRPQQYPASTPQQQDNAQPDSGTFAKPAESPGSWLVVGWFATDCPSIFRSVAACFIEAGGFRPFFPPKPGQTPNLATILSWLLGEHSPLIRKDVLCLILRQPLVPAERLEAGRLSHAPPLRRIKQCFLARRAQLFVGPLGVIGGERGLIQESRHLPGRMPFLPATPPDVGLGRDDALLRRLGEGRERKWPMALAVEQNEPMLTSQRRVHSGNAFPPSPTAMRRMRWHGTPPKISLAVAA